MRHSDREELIDRIMQDTIPMHGRMIHGKEGEELWEAAQLYDVHGRVSASEAEALQSMLVVHQA